MFLIGGKIVGTMETSLENFDASPHLIPKRILNKICNTANSVEISFHIDHDENKYIGGTPNE